jgi:hypothetical protein
MALLTPVEQQTKDVFGMVPMEERLSILPRYSATQGLIAPQFVYDIAKAVSAPITAARGYQVTPEEAVNTAINAFGGGGLGTAPKGALRTFIGRTAKTWDGFAEKKFLELEKKGVDPVEIWRQTGTFRGADNKLRQEISDVSAKAMFQPNQMDLLDAFSKINYGKPYGALPFGEKGGLGEQRTKITKLVDQELKKFQSAGKILSHSDLYAAYPELGKIPTTATKKDYMEGSYGRTLVQEGRKSPISTISGEEISAYAPSEQQLKSAMLHELQHAIQQREGFATGGSPVLLQKEIDDLKKAFDIASARLAEAKDPIAKSNALQEMSFYGLRLGEKKKEIGRTGTEAYRRMAGEAEARAVQARMNMTPAQRSQVFPLESYDVPKEQLIIRGLID